MLLDDSPRQRAKLVYPAKLLSLIGPTRGKDIQIMPSLYELRQMLNEAVFLRRRSDYPITVPGSDSPERPKVLWRWGSGTGLGQQKEPNERRVCLPLSHFGQNCLF